VEKVVFKPFGLKQYENELIQQTGSCREDS